MRYFYTLRKDFLSLQASIYRRKLKLCGVEQSFEAVRICSHKAGEDSETMLTKEIPKGLSTKQTFGSTPTKLPPKTIPTKESFGTKSIKLPPETIPTKAIPRAPQTKMTPLKEILDGMHYSDYLVFCSKE